MARWGKGRNTVMRVIYKERPVPVSRGIGASSHHEPPMSLYVGTSGFAYKAWKGSFYPRDLPEKRMLHYYGEHFRAVEINNTFYRMPSASVLEAWAEEVPADFRFVLKASQRITHQHRLTDADEDVGHLLDVAGVLGTLPFKAGRAPVLFP